MPNSGQPNRLISSPVAYGRDLSGIIGYFSIARTYYYSAAPGRGDCIERRRPMWGNPEHVRKKSPKLGVVQGGPLISSDRSKQEDGAGRPSETVAPEELQEQFAALLARHHYG